MKKLYQLAAAALLLAAGNAALAEPPQFRIETKLYNTKAKEAVSYNTTLFDAGIVYDYLFTGPKQTSAYRVTVFDQQRGRFIVLDPAHKLKAEVKTEEVKLFADTCQAMAAKSSRAFTKFAAEPEFDLDFDEEGVLTLSSEFINYKLSTEPAGSAEAAQVYRDFSDWYARFNNMCSPGSTPPFPRMAVNDELARRTLVPTEVELSIPSRSISMRSEHHVAWRLLPKDHRRIAGTAAELTTFKLIAFDKFQEINEPKK